MIDAVRLRILLVALSGWVNRHQLDVIEYLREENRVLKERYAAWQCLVTIASRMGADAIARRRTRDTPSPDSALLTPHSALSTV